MERNTSLYNAILAGDRIAARDAAKNALSGGAPALELLNASMLPAMREIGERFSRHEVIVPDLLVSARAMQAGLAEIEPALVGHPRRKRARVCIGSVQGDQHDIGKNLVVIMLKAVGYEVDDLGVDCSADRFAQAVAAGARAVLCSCLNARSAEYLEAIAVHFSGGNFVPVIIGGAAISEEYGRRIGAYAYGTTANDAVRILDGLFKDGE